MCVRGTEAALNVVGEAPEVCDPFPVGDLKCRPQVSPPNLFLCGQQTQPKPLGSWDQPLFC